MWQASYTFWHGKRVITEGADGLFLSKKVVILMECARRYVMLRKRQDAENPGVPTRWDSFATNSAVSKSSSGPAEGSAMEVDHAQLLPEFDAVCAWITTNLVREAASLSRSLQILRGMIGNSAWGL